jgi:hypothetical protein
MPSGKQLLLRVIAWLAVRAGARLGPDGRPIRRADFSGAALAGAVTANRAGRLVGVEEEPEVHRSLAAHWAFWAVVALILAVVAAIYLRRRWRSRERQLWPPSPVWDRDGPRK